MWSAIVTAVLGIVDKVISLFKSKQEHKIEEFKKKNTDEEVRKAVLIRDVEIKDEAEKIVGEVKNAKTPEEKQKKLDEIRRRTGAS